MGVFFGLVFLLAWILGIVQLLGLCARALSFLIRRASLSWRMPWVPGDKGDAP